MQKHQQRPRAQVHCDWSIAFGAPRSNCVQSTMLKISTRIQTSPCVFFRGGETCSADGKLLLVYLRHLTEVPCNALVVNQSATSRYKLTPVHLCDLQFGSDPACG